MSANCSLYCAIFASGTVSSRPTAEDRSSGEGNNVLFPAMGMAVYATEAKRVTDDILITAAKPMPEQATDLTVETG